MTRPRSRRAWDVVQVETVGLAVDLQRHAGGTAASKTSSKSIR